MPTNSYQKSFLSWQTWDLMRVCWYGFRDFCHDFFCDHPGYCVTPLRLNGSSIETIFSQLKHASRGSLTAVTYESARAQLLTRRSLHGQSHIVMHHFMSRKASFHSRNVTESDMTISDVISRYHSIVYYIMTYCCLKKISIIIMCRSDSNNQCKLVHLMNVTLIE